MGCHDGTTNPLGTLANERLRDLRRKVHLKIDSSWKNGFTSRIEVYKHIAKFLNIDIKQCHVGMFNESTCKKILTDYQPLPNGRDR